MTFAQPQLLWLLLLPLALLAWEIVRDRRLAQASHPKILQGRAGTRDFELLPSRTGSLARARPRVWLFLGLALAVASLARPQYGRIEEQVFDQSREIMLAVDLSRSMLAEDVKPSRLGRAKLLIGSLLERLAGERVGLVLFSGTAFVQSPLSSDYEILHEFLPVLEPGYLPAGGSNYGALLRAAGDAFGETATADRFLIVLSDGEATDETWRDEIPALKAKGVRIVGLGVGTPGGSMIPDGAGGFVKDERGAVVMSKLENATLQELAEQTSGIYRDASGWVDVAALLQETVEAGRQGTFKSETRVRLAERFQWVLAPALLCLLISYWREFPVRPKPRDLRLPAATRSGPGQLAALLLAGLALSAAAPRAAAATLAPGAQPAPAGSPAEPAAEDPAQVAAAPLAKAVERLSRQARHAAADWSELARLTVTYGNQLLSANQQVPEGPVRDALQGVELGAALDPRAANWADLRKQLEELLKKAEEPPPEEPPPPPEPEQKQEQESKSEEKSGEGKSDPNQPKSQNPSQNPGQQPPSEEEQEPDPNAPDPKTKEPEEKGDAQSAFGDMNEDGQPDEQEPTDQPPRKDQTQKVGGNPTRQPPGANPTALTVPLQHLEELREKDNPGDLFQMMDDQPAEKPSGKDW